jgi:chitodextrinase
MSPRRILRAVPFLLSLTFWNSTSQAATLSAPYSLTATAVSSGQVNLSWLDNNNSEQGFAIERSLDALTGWVHIGTNSKDVLTYTDVGLSPLTTYFYRVRAAAQSGDYSPYSAVASARTLADITAPSIPTGLKTSVASCSQVLLSWTASADTGGSGLAGYKVFRGGVQVGTTALTTFNNIGLVGSTSYSYTVAAYDKAGNTSSKSTAASATTPACADTTAPSVPTGLSATAASCSQVNLSWSASTDTGGSGLRGYKVFRGGVQVGTTTLTSFSNTGLGASTSYSFTVAAYDGAGNTSAQSTAASATTPACADFTAPSVPTGLTATAASCSQVNLSWSASTDTGGSGLAGYKVFRGGVQVGTTTLTSFSNTGLGASTSYSFTVAAYDGAGNTSAQSTAASATTPACANLPPVADAGLDQSATVGNVLTFNGSRSYDPDGTIASYAWSFGDGGTGTGSVVNHAYTTAGTYTATLTVTDNLGATDTDTAQVNVQVATLGAFAWSRDFGGPALSDAAISHGVAVDGSGNAVVTGEFTGTVGFGGGSLTSAGDVDIFVVKYSSAGVYAWSKRFGGTGTDRGYGVAVDSTGNVLVTGYFSGTVDFGGGPLTSAGNADIFVAKFTSAGAHVWSKRFGSTGHDFGYGIAVDRNSDLVVTGFFGWFGGPTVDFGGGALTSAGDTDVFLVKLSATGTHLWSKRMGGTGGDRGLGIAIDQSGNVAVTGTFTATASFGGASLTSRGLRDIFIAEYSSSGAHLWSKGFGDVSDDSGNSIAMDASGNVIATGNFYGTVDFGGGPLDDVGAGNMFLAKFTPTGAHIWSKRFGQGNNTALGVATDPTGNILLTGSIVSDTDFGGGYLSGNGSWDIFVAKLSASGAHLWSRRFGPLWDDHGNAVTTDSNGNIIVTGDFYESVDFGGGTLLSPGGYDTFLVRFGP